MQENKERAVTLREQGYTYKQIVEALDGAVSLDWCKKTLKHIKKPKEDDECLKELLELGCRPEGVTHYEANGIIYKHRPNATKSNMDYIKEKAKKADSRFVIHTGWIDHMKPNESHKAMNAFALHLMDQVDLMVEDYIETFPNSNKWSVRYEMLKLAFSKQISPEPLLSRVYTNEKLAERMEDRNTALL